MYAITHTEKQIFNNMTKEQIFGVIRHTMTALGGILIAKGLIADGAWTELSGAIITLTGVIWSIVSKKQA